MVFEGVATEKITLFFDYVDPASYLMHELIGGSELAPLIDWRGFEVRAPPDDLVDPESEDWSRYQDEMLGIAEALGVDMSVPFLVPWSRKAHELGALAREKNCYGEVRRALFRAHFVDGVDIGRIDLLVQIGQDTGLDRSEVKAALDVDHHTGTVLSDRATAEELSVVGVPTLVRDGVRLEGLRTVQDIQTWVANQPYRSIQYRVRCP